MKFIVLILLAAVVVSLFSGLFFLVKDRDKPESTRMLQSLKIRVGLSITLIIFLVAAYSLGWLSP
ncbi:MAG: twin transmembrane helix small protein [Gammaproteobacteria bacterium]|nr:twin transmembrane helix small protein [Gammaproteobacteria bacterium]MDH3756568.1 twin transmembrane helix small protein [Gammaproteobacteria bacterium]MDH3846215.1 twin transmembrane helix small protein [Gammaproteobacteria bacterium]MDH3862362.1 twin transmembrane helix small protein [Gammaproteobacteria bacterium]MDH3904659.1 twin transmembrane helix small protein [Gammaproteobacteria bacterium]